MPKRYVTLLAMGALLLGGCLGRTRLWDPGTAEKQQQRAQHWDPYPEPDIGPDVSEVRPRDFQLPVPEAERVRRTPPTGAILGFKQPMAVPVR